MSPSRGSARLRRAAVLLAVLGAIAALAVVVPPAGAVDPPWHIRRLPLGGLLGAPDPGSHLVGCDHADEKLVITTSTHLDGDCTYHRGIEVRGSDVVLDCRGARIADTTGKGSRGILIAAPTSVALHDVTVRNCNVWGFLNSVHVARDGFKALPAGGEYEHPFERIVVENSRLMRSRAAASSSTPSSPV